MSAVQIQTSNFIVIEKALKKSADQLRNQNNEETISTISGISKEIRFLATASGTIETTCKKEQENLANLIQEIIVSETTIRDSYLSTQKSIEDLNVNICKKP